MWSDPFWSTIVFNIGLILLWYFFGTTLSLWNKLLIGAEEGHGLFGEGRFPAPFLMSAVQFFSQYLLARGMLSSGCVRRQCQQTLSWKEYCKHVVPNGVATGLDIGLSNTSLAFISLSFYVMLKSTTPLFLLTFAILWGIEKMTWTLAGVVSIISLGLFFLVAGETEFNLVGFIMVMTASALSGLRWTITQVLLQGDAHSTSKGGPLEIIEALTPIMGGTLLLTSLCTEKLWVSLPQSAFFATGWNTFVTSLVLMAGGIIALCMVWAEFTLIANTSALTFMVAGTFKEIVTVGAAVLFLHEEFTPINAVGLVILILGVSVYNYVKYQKYKEKIYEEQMAVLMESEYGELRAQQNEERLSLLPPVSRSTSSKELRI
jgi:solute carrier family 35 protein C2